MLIPIQNIYYLLCYAWNKLDESEVVQVDAAAHTSLLNLFAKVLINGTIYLLKKGLDRDYVTREEVLQRIRGKLLFATSLKRNLLNNAKAACQYDELSHNIIHNRILKTTMKRLLKADDLDAQFKDELIMLYRRLPPIDELALTNRDFFRVRLHRNNSFYDFLLAICQIIYEGLLLDEDTGKYKFRDFLRDENRMNLLFEEFVRNFLKLEQTDYKVSREHIPWALEKAGPQDHYLPQMETDISLTAKDGHKKIVIDTKYYASGFKTSAKIGPGEKLISSNLYQLYSYLKNLETKSGINQHCEGILLYAAVDETADYTFSFPGHQLHVKTLNLNQDWKSIDDDLRRMIV